jgi:CheY-like chemotaxis protein
MTLHLAMVLHELGTNSLKYGAFSASSGWVNITWSCHDSVLHLEWVERGGPAVMAPRTAGFGTTLIEQSAASQGGRARMLCEAEGVSWKITLPIPASATKTPLQPRVPLASPSRPIEKFDGKHSLLAGKRLLVIEDEPLIALDIIASLEEAGAQPVPAVGTKDKALKTIEEGEFDGVLLDANLHNEGVEEIAAMLARKGVPFLFVTGYGREGLPQTFRQAKCLTKPFNDEQLIAAVLELQPRGAAVIQMKQ